MAAPPRRGSLGRRFRGAASGRPARAAPSSSSSGAPARRAARPPWEAPRLAAEPVGRRRARAALAAGAGSSLRLQLGQCDLGSELVGAARGLEVRAGRAGADDPLGERLDAPEGAVAADER